jgi:hypothetical protein
MRIDECSKPLKGTAGMTEPDNLVVQLLREMRSDMSEMRSEMADMRSVMATKSDIADVRSEVRSLRADVASDMVALEKRLSDQIVGLRRAVMEYHSSAIGHGLLISEFEDRLRRV